MWNFKILTYKTMFVKTIFTFLISFDGNEKLTGNFPLFIKTAKVSVFLFSR